jgi:hypothetical protein
MFAEPDLRDTPDGGACAPGFLARHRLQGLRPDVEALHARLKADLGAADYQHLLKMIRWSRACTLLGYALAWPFPIRSRRC